MMSVFPKYPTAGIATRNFENSLLIDLSHNHTKKLLPSVRMWLQQLFKLVD